MLMPSQLQHITNLMESLLKFEHPADSVVAAYMRQHPKLGAKDRALIAQTVFACLRHLEQLHALLGPGANTRTIVLACLGLIQNTPIPEMEKLLKPGENKWLSSLKHMELPKNVVVQSGLPQWILDLLPPEQDTGDIIRMGRALMQPAPMDLRVNTLKAKRPAIEGKLLESDIAVTETPYSPIGLRLAGHPPINQHPAFVAGEIEVQDEGSQILGMLLDAKRGEMVVDFCAGAGGKTLLLGAMMASTGRLYAFDISAKRLAKLKPRLARSGLSNVTPQLIENENDSHIKRLAGKIDRVLVDAPCSGLGTLRRNPDLKYRQNPLTIQRLSELQAAILASASRLLKPGGRLVYGTCSFLPQENQQIIEAFLAQHPEFNLIPADDVLVEKNIPLTTGQYLELRPHKHQTDGFFGAILTKKA